VVAWLVFIGVMTLRPTATSAVVIPNFCLACGELGGVDVILNVALFVPLGAGLVRAGLRGWPAVFLGMLVSLGIEGLQYSAIPGRDASVSDLITNTVGSALGVGIATWWRTVLAPRRALAGWMAVGALTLSLGILAFTSTLLRPAVPIMGLWGQWTPQRLHFEPYGGTVHGFEVNGIAVPYNLVPEYETLRQRLITGEIRARATITTGEPTRRLGVITRLGSNAQEVLLLGVHGDNLVLRTRLAARDWGLRLPAIAVPGALPRAGERVTVEGGLRQRHWFASAQGDRGTQTREVPFSIALGWTMLLPFDYAMGPGAIWWSALWLAALALPAATWGSQAGRGQRALTGGFNLWWLGVTLVLVVGAWQVTRNAAFAPLSAIEWAGITIGTMAGALAAPWLVRRVET
jgi:hypothetical protein